MFGFKTNNKNKMKFTRIISIVLIIISSLSVFPQKSKMNQQDGNGKQGLWRFYNRDGQLLREVNYKNDVKHGACIIYYPLTGKPKEESNFYDGKREEEYKTYYMTGELKCEGSYKDNKKDGLWSTYDRVSGEKRTEGNYKENKKDGEWSYWNSKGQLMSKGKYVAGQKDGVWEYYDSDGKLKYKETYANGKLAGTEGQENKNTTQPPADQQAPADSLNTGTPPVPTPEELTKPEEPKKKK